jgi:FkbM family methyltransferase
MESSRSRLVRQAKSALAKSLWASIGRRNLARLGRFLSNEARLDVPNDMARNGELDIQRQSLANATSGTNHVFDVGANVGDWSLNLLECARELRRDVALHAFEPAPATFSTLKGRLAGFGSVRLVQAAASNESGNATLHLVNDTAGVNSLHARTDMVQAGTVSVPTVRLDDYCRAENIDRVLLIKCDTEGHDFAVLQSAESLLKAGAIDVFQFEYNWRWVDARRYLRDVFDFVLPLGYGIGKVTPRGVERYERWDPELESYREGNYVLLAPSTAGWFTTLPWWNQ